MIQIKTVIRNSENGDIAEEGDYVQFVLKDGSVVQGTIEDFENGFIVLSCDWTDETININEYYIINFFVILTK